MRARLSDRLQRAAVARSAFGLRPGFPKQPDATLLVRSGQSPAGDSGHYRSYRIIVAWRARIAPRRLQSDQRSAAFSQRFGATAVARPGPSVARGQFHCGGKAADQNAAPARRPAALRLELPYPLPSARQHALRAHAARPPGISSLAGNLYRVLLDGNRRSPVDACDDTRAGDKRGAHGQEWPSTGISGSTLWKPNDEARREKIAPASFSSRLGSAVRSIVFLLYFAAVLPTIAFNPFCGVILWSWLSFMSPQRLTFGITSDMPFAIVVAVATLIAWLFSREKKRLPADVTLWLIVALMLWFSLTTYYALVPDAAYGKWLSTCKALLFVLVTAAMLTNRIRFHALIWTMVISISFYG